MKRKKSITSEKIFLLLIIMIFITSCSDTGTGPTSSGTTETQYRFGKEGLVISFLPGSPPEKVFSDSDVSALFQIKNKGSTDIKNARIYLTGYDKKYLFNSDNMLQLFSIPGKSPYNPQGEMIELIEFNTHVKELDKDIDKFKQTFKATLCYSYETIASPTICIDPTRYQSTTSTSVCAVKPVSLSGGQGGPISVDKVEEEMMGDQILFKVHISNSGGGTPFIKTGEDCFRTLKYSEIDLVDVKEVSFSDYDLTYSCKPNPIRLTNNKGDFVCTTRSQDMFGESSYMTPLKIHLKYNYRSSIKKDFEIIKI